MKVYNLTDVPTPVLEQRGLNDKQIAVGNRMVAPGEFVEVEDTPDMRSKLEYLLTVQAVSIDNAPPPYVHARTAKNASTGMARQAHLNVQETRVAGEKPPDPKPVEGERVELARADPSKEPTDPPAAEGKRGTRR